MNDVHEFCGAKVTPFLIVGGQRCATGWLSRCLSEHPEIFMADDESRYFERNYEPGVSWEKRIRASEKYRHERFVGEKTANYLTDPKVPERIWNELPEMKIIVVVRDPLDRAISQYLYKFQALPQISDLENDKAFFDDMVNRGRYAFHLKRYFKFFSSERVKVVVYEDKWNGSQLDIIRDVLQFIAVENTSFVPPSLVLQTKLTSRHTTNAFSKILGRVLLSRYSPFRSIYSYFASHRPYEHDDKLVQIFKDVLFEDALMLERILNRDLSHWSILSKKNRSSR